MSPTENVAVVHLVEALDRMATDGFEIVELAESMVAAPDQAMRTATMQLVAEACGRIDITLRGAAMALHPFTQHTQEGNRA